MDEVPPMYKQPIPIAVLDTWFDKEHCELKDNVEFIVGPPPGGSNRRAAGVCGEAMSGPVGLNEADDHGTHVAGLIASAPNGKGIVGLNPYAKLKYIFVDTDQLRGQGYRLSLGTKILEAGLFKFVRVANISWQYSNEVGSDTSDTIRMNIDNLKQKTLFVVAAGNAAKEFDDACNVLPACLSNSNNVITVVGLDRNPGQPKLWRDGSLGSNSSQKFSVCAIAEDVLSTAYRNYTGRLSGTSQAFCCINS